MAAKKLSFCIYVYSPSSDDAKIKVRKYLDMTFLAKINRRKNFPIYIISVKHTNSSNTVISSYSNKAKVVIVSCHFRLYRHGLA